jgi:hypothetical protein
MASVHIIRGMRSGGFVPLIVLFTFFFFNLVFGGFSDTVSISDCVASNGRRFLNDKVERTWKRRP